MTIIEKLKSRLAESKENALPEVCPEMLARISDNVAGGIDVWARWQWNKAIG
jgi:hypothetical protein